MCWGTTGLTETEAGTEMVIMIKTETRAKTETETETEAGTPAGIVRAQYPRRSIGHTQTHTRGS